MGLSSTTTKLSELPLRTSLSPFTTLNSLLFSSSSYSHFSHSNFNKFPLQFLNSYSSSFPTIHRNYSSNTLSSPWLTKWPSNPNPPPYRKTLPDSNPDGGDDGLFDPIVDTRYSRNNDDDKPSNAIDRVVLRLRNLGLQDEEQQQYEVNEVSGDLLGREWIRPDTSFREDNDDMVLPWEKEEVEEEKGETEGEKIGLRKRRVKAKTLAEMTLDEEEMRRLRRIGMQLRDKVNVPKAGLTKVVLDKIHDGWRKSEMVRLKFHEVLAKDMKAAHQIVELRTRGLVIWRAGSLMLVYRGSNYERSTSGSQLSNSLLRTEGDNATSSLEENEPVVRNQGQPEIMTPEELDFNRLLDGLGPRFVEWWGTGILPVDADLLPPTVPGYKTPLRLVPAGMRPRLTDAQLTNMRKISKPLPCHFALGRNRNHQGLASAILKLWETSLVAKIAIKRGIQNTNSELMAEELKKLTGGTLLIRNKYYIVIYRGNDFVPTSVASVLAERQELTKQVQEVEDMVRSGTVDVTPSEEGETTAQAGTLTEFYEAQVRWGRDISTEEHEKMMKEAAEVKNVKLFKKIERKLALAQAKRLRAEELLRKVEASLIPAGPDYDQETITDEERVMFRRVGLSMKAYLELGTRGVFDGVIENMHLHWRHRELVKLITKQKTLTFVEDTARLLAYESGGILVSIDRVPKGFTLIYYRGKNYRRPITMRPRNLLTKAKALKRAIAMQRHEALSQHITELGKKIEEMRKGLALSQDLKPEDRCSIEDHNQIHRISEFAQNEDEGSDYDDSDAGFDYEDDGGWDDEDSECPN
ncbi:PREDICTED: CRM-domain containing factor CFM3A, chloroplastic/mitochondrial-like isoform X2 [Lupinus angustifolius]|nr:PREDICTED: CRM-domain containing factor CFM3A, chloroplastic/mitochondrial-like isoform X2 [Lupinus angustifolius]XP_019446261.1 PREDICTED: CRM-domain containing factor CFM3A, chloroplastic/mitochondrial-like isoform X2 [Lupinus angustifolius]